MHIISHSADTGITYGIQHADGGSNNFLLHRIEISCSPAPVGIRLGKTASLLAGTPVSAYYVTSCRDRVPDSVPAANTPVVTSVSGAAFGQYFVSPAAPLILDYPEPLEFNLLHSFVYSIAAVDESSTVFINIFGEDY